MAFGIGSWIKVWEVKDRGTFRTIKFSASHKKKDGGYITSCTGFATFDDKVAKKAENIQAGDRIHVLNFTVTSWYNEENQKNYYNFQILDFEFNQDKEIDNTPNPLEVGLSDEEEDMPF